MTPTPYTHVFFHELFLADGRSICTKDGRQLFGDHGNGATRGACYPIGPRPREIYRVWS